MSRAPRTLKKQKEFIIEFLGEHRFLLGGKVNPINLPKVNKTWETLAEKLNVIGPGKTLRQWKETISEMKTNVRRRAREIKYGHTGTGGGAAVKPLTDLEERLLSLISELNVEGMNLTEAGAPEKENQAPEKENVAPNSETDFSMASDTPVLILAENRPMNVTFEEQISIPLLTDTEENMPSSSHHSNPVPLRKKIARKIPKKNQINQNSLDRHDKTLIHMAKSNFAIARAVNNLAKAITILAKKT